MIKTTHFSIKELVHPQIVLDIGEQNCWARLDGGCLIDLDKIREAWGDIIYINLGKHDSRGLRPPNDPDGAKYSIHKQGAAFDLVPANGQTKRLFKMIKSMIQLGDLKTFNTLENFEHTPSWVHVAKMNTSEKPWIINP